MIGKSEYHREDCSIIFATILVALVIVCNLVWNGYMVMVHHANNRSYLHEISFHGKYFLAFVAAAIFVGWAVGSGVYNHIRLEPADVRYRQDR
jgi:hypothetical protein